MYDFLTGPASFDLYLKTSDKNVLHNGRGGFSFILQKPMEFSSEWEVGVKQFIAKSPIVINNADIRYTLQEASTRNEVKSSFSLQNFIPDSPSALINQMNEVIPETLKKQLSFTLDKDEFVNINVKNTKLKIQSPYLADLLGLKDNHEYPNEISTEDNQIQGKTKIKLTIQVFTLKTDVTVPERETILMDVFSDNIKYENYKYERISYYRILQNFISVLNIEIKDLSSKSYRFYSHIVVKLHFGRSSDF